MKIDRIEVLHRTGGEMSLGPRLEDVALHRPRVPAHPSRALPWSDAAAWAATHGLATLRIQSQPGFWSADEDAAAEAKLLDMVLAGLVDEPPP